MRRTILPDPVSPGAHRGGARSVEARRARARRARARLARARLAWAVMAWAVLAGPFLFLSAPASAGPTTHATPTASVTPSAAALTLLYTNDARGRMLPSVVDEAEAGGLPLRAGHLKRLRGGPGATLLVTAGNNLFPGHLGVLDEGRGIVSALARMQYDAAGVGPMDLEYGLDVLLARAKDARFPFVCANLLRKGASFPGEPPVGSAAHGSQTTFPFLPGWLCERGGLRVGLTGVTQPSAVAASGCLSGDLDTVAPRRAVEAVVPRLRAAGADVVIVLASVGFEDCVELAGLPGVDVVVRTRATAGEQQLRKLHDVRLDGGAAVLTVPSDDLAIGTAEVAVGPRGLRVGAAALTPVDGSVEEDGVLRHEIEELQVRLIARHAKQVTELTEAGARRFPELCCDIMRERLRCEVALVNRSFFGDGAVPGPLRVVDLNELMSFADTLARVELKGARLRELVESHEADLVTAGVARRGKRWTVNGRPLDDAVTYSVATVSWLARGGGGFLTGVKCTQTDTHARDEVQERLGLLPEADPRVFRNLGRRSIWTAKASVESAVSRVLVNEAASAYGSRGIPGLAVAGSTKARGSFELDFKRDTVAADLTTTAKGRYEELDGTRSVDKLLLECLYERKLSLDGPRPFIDVQLDTTLTARSLTGDERPYTLKLAAGHAYRLSRYFKARAGLSSIWQLGSLDGDPTYGLDLTMEFERPLREGATFSSKLNYFWSYAGLKIEQVKWENQLRVGLFKRLGVSLRADTLLYEDDRVARVARSTEVYAGLSYDVSVRRWR